MILNRTLFTNKITFRMISSAFTYEDAVLKLNSLQSNKASVEQIRKDIKSGLKCTNLEDMENYLMRTGIKLSTLDKLSVIHVAGTKGKGSTSAMCESILRHHGCRTGFYSSPHLVAVCERIRLNGEVISKKKFAEYFHSVFNMLEKSQAYNGDMPKYFAFLTVLAFNIFIKENVDIAVVEVGIGGAVDYTNILRAVPVVGITSLGLDHTSILGNTIEEIAMAKAGIMKPGCEAYTVTQPPNALNILYKIAIDIKCPLHIVPDYTTYLFPKDVRAEQLPMELEAYCMNASLAIQLAHAWLRVRQNQKHNITKINDENVTKKRNGYKEDRSSLIECKDDKVLEKSINVNSPIIRDIPLNTLVGLKNCKWPGRYQVINTDYAQFYVDGAHTKESMEICAKWFLQQHRNKSKILIFSATGDRDVDILLKPLSNIDFQSVFFVIPTALKDINQRNDNYSAMEEKELLLRCHNNADKWRKMHTQTAVNISVFECVHDALKQLETNASFASVLITGSLHLVGAALSILDSSLTV